MAQLMRPISTVTDQGNFTGPTAHGSVDGTAPDTTDWWYGTNGNVEYLETLLTDLSSSTPGTGTCTVTIYEAQADSDAGTTAPTSGGTNATFDLEVYEGATQVAVSTGNSCNEGSFASFATLTFSSASVTNWANVRVRFTSTGSGGNPNNRRVAAVSYIEISVPDSSSTTPQTVSATHTATASLSTTVTKGQALSASHTGTATAATVSTRYRTYSASHTATAALTAVKSAFQSLSANHFATASLASAKSFFTTLSASHVGTATLATVQVIGQTLSAAHTATADLLKTIGKSLSATHFPVVVLSTTASHFRTLGATSVKTASLATTKIGNALLSATHTATAALTSLQVLGVTLSASATHTASLLEQKISSVVLSATHTATSTFQKLIGFILGATHTGSASLSAQSLVATPQLMSASATHGATLDKKVIKLVSASHTGLPTMRKGVSPSPLSASHTGTASLDTANLMTVTLPALHSMTPAMQTVFMEALVVASTIRKPVNKDIELPSFQSWHGAYRPSFDQLIAIGYAAGASALSYGSTVTGLNTLDGKVAFNESFLGYPAELSASTVYVVSSSPSDTGDIRVQGLNDSGIYQDRTVTLTGTTPVAVPGLWNHVQRMTLVDTTNVGIVYCSTNSGGLPTTLAHQIQCVMPVGANYAINPLLVAGENQLILINRFDFSTANRDSMKVLIEANRQGNWIQNFVFYTSDSQFAQDFKTPIALQPGAKLRCWVEMTGGSNGDASFGMNGFVMSDTIEKRAFKDQAGVDHFFT